MFGALINAQTVALAMLAVGLPLLGLPEIKKAIAYLRGTGAKISLPGASGSMPTLIEAVQAAEVMQRHYACRCNEAQSKLQLALTHFHDPVVKPPNVVRANNLHEAVQLLSAAVAPQTSQASE